MTPTTHKVQLTIVGTGFRGISLGQNLAKSLANHPMAPGFEDHFAIIGDHLGGRTAHDDKDSLGASLVSSMNRAVFQYVDKGAPLDPLKEVFYEHGAKRLPILKVLFDPKTLFPDRGKQFWKIPQTLFSTVRVMLNVLQFKMHYSRLIRDMAKMPEAQALNRRPWLKSLRTISAKTLINKWGFADVHDSLMRLAIHSVYFADVAKLSAYDYLHVLSSLGAKIWEADFTNTESRLRQGLEGRLYENETITEVTRRDDGLYSIRTDTGKEWISQSVVYATPWHQIRRIHKMTEGQEHLLASAADFCPEFSVLRIQGKRKASIEGMHTVVLDPNNERDLAVITASPSGHDVVYAKTPQPDLSEFYEDGVKILGGINWNPAFSLGTRPIIPFEIAAGVYVVGGLETMDMAILSGLGAARYLSAMLLSNHPYPN